MNTLSDSGNDKKSIIEEITAAGPYKVVLSQAEGSYKKTVISDRMIGGKRMYQIERFTEKQAFHENIHYEELAVRLNELFGTEYKQMNAFSTSLDISAKISKKGKILVKRSKSQIDKIEVPSNNRRKKYLLPEGTVIPPLYDMGIFTGDGKIVRSMYDKYKQINRFIEMIDDVIGNEKSLHIIDFGCGKSYLTFIVYYYLTEIKGMDVKITGLDLKEEVIRKCNHVAEKYGYRNLKFLLGDINGYRTDEKVDMVITLHACDTATDYALYNAICWNAKYILSVPCCQHEVNKEIDCDELMPLMKYGIIKQRTAELVTDSLRAELLEYSGYKTQLLEFIDIAHSPKNLLIRAVKTEYSAERREKSLKEAKEMCRIFHVNPTLLRLLNKNP